jgi:hypothetical protein
MKFEVYVFIVILPHRQSVGPKTYTLNNRVPPMTTKLDAQEEATGPPPGLSPSTTEVQPPNENPSHTTAPSESDSDAPRKHKRRSGNSVDLSYRYHEPSDDELSWTEDEHGTRRRRKSKKRKSGGGDDFKAGIVYFNTFGVNLMVGLVKERSDDGEDEVDRMCRVRVRTVTCILTRAPKARVIPGTKRSIAFAGMS